MKFPITLASLALLLSTSAFAGFNVPEMQEVTRIALEDLAREDAGHALHVTGWKTWKSGDDVKVKIYLDHDGMAMESNYLCHKHGDGKLQCHAQ